MSTQIYGKRHKEGREIRQLEPSHEEIVSLISALLALWSFERFLRKESQLGMPQPAAALSITNTMNPHLFFFIIPIEAAHLRLPRRPPQFGGGVAATKLEQEIRKN